MLGRVGAFLLLAAIAVPYWPVPLVDSAEGNGAFDELVRVFPYNGISVQDRNLVLTEAEAFDKFYFVMEATEAISLPEADEGFTSLGMAKVEVKRFGTSDVVCEGQVFHISSGQKHQLCEGLRPETHYQFTYINTFPAEIQMWGASYHDPNQE